MSFKTTCGALKRWTFGKAAFPGAWWPGLSEMTLSKKKKKKKKNEAFTGNYQRNPFNFQLFNLSDIKLLFDGEEYPGPTIYISEGRQLDAYN